MISIDQFDRLRKKLDLTIGDMCYLLGVTRPTYDRWTKGLSNLQQRSKVRFFLVARGMLRALKSKEYDKIMESKYLSKPQKRAKIVELIEDIA